MFVAWFLSKDFKLCLLVKDKRVWRDALHQEYVATDCRSCSDHGFTAEHSGVWIDSDVILNGGMTFAAFFDFAVLVFLKAARAQCDGMIQLHPRSDFAGLADDHARAVVHEESHTDLCAGIIVSP